MPYDTYKSHHVLHLLLLTISVLPSCVLTTLQPHSHPTPFSIPVSFVPQALCFCSFHLCFSLGFLKKLHHDFYSHFRFTEKLCDGSTEFLSTLPEVTSLNCPHLSPYHSGQLLRLSLHLR